MAYYTGTTTSGADLITAIQNAAVANSWVLTSGILSKGNVYAQLSQWNPVIPDVTPAKGVGIQVGTGASGAALTGANGNIVGVRTDMDTTYGAVPLVYPCTYHIFINESPDEIVVAVNYNSLYWQWLAFGQSTTIGITGTGIYCWGSMFPGTASTDAHAGFTVDSAFGYRNKRPCFYGQIYQRWVIGTNIASSWIHLDMDSQDWWGNQFAAQSIVDVYYSVGDILRKQPNTWNSESLLVRTMLLAQRADSFWSYVAEFPHFRYVRNTFFDDGEVITLGSDDWFVAPIIKKDLDHPLGQDALLEYHSGTNGFAVRKTT